MMRMSWYSVSLSRMMSGSVTVVDSSLLLLEWGRLDCLREGEVKGILPESIQMIGRRENW